MEFTRQTAPEILDRFDEFRDAVIRRVEIRPEDWSARVELDAKDRTDEWCRVRFEFEGVKEWRFEQIRTDMVGYLARSLCRLLEHGPPMTARLL